MRRAANISFVFTVFFFTAIAAAAQDNLQFIHSLEDSAKYYEALNKNLTAYAFTQRVHRILMERDPNDIEKIGRAESDLGTYAYRMGNIALSEKHHRKALELFESMAVPDYECVYLSGNNMGGIMWFASKTDSALHYFTVAMNALAKMDSTPYNRYYRPAVLNNNLAAIYGIQGKTTEGIAAMKKTISYLRRYLSIDDPKLRRDGAMHMQFEAADNLAGIYKELGDYRRAHDLLMHSYQEKQKALGPTDVDVFKSEVLLGQIYFAMKEFSKADQYLESGLRGLEKADGDLLFWQADAYNTLSLLHDATDDKKQAAVYFKKAEELYEQSLQGDFDDIYLEFLRNASLFYAENKDAKTAVAKGLKGYKYVVKNQGQYALPVFYELLNLGQIYFELGNYQQALQYSRKGLDVVNKLTATAENSLDSVKTELKKPKALLLMVRSEYELTQQKTQPALERLLSRLEEALELLEKRKSVIDDPHDIGLLMADHAELLEFAKKIIFELHELTHDESYVDQLVSLHESGLYNRIRSRIDKNGNMEFAHVPDEIQKKERELKHSLSTILAGNESHDEKMRLYIQSQGEWNKFLEKLKQEYPDYYKMRYGSIFKSLDEIMPDIPLGTTVIRYLFVGEDLLALVADRQHRTLIKLDAVGLDKDIAAANRYAASAGKLSGTLYNLYCRLWKPLEEEITNTKVIIIPDGIIYALNFEILTPKKISRFEEFASASLLAKHAISYQYSLFLLKQQHQNTKAAENFVAFAPGFSDRIKQMYRRHSDTASQIDNFYLNLLPQPFTVSLAVNTAGLFGGDLFMDEESTVGSFKKYANNHRIIHIGTHAVADNLHPEFSRLIFSKDVSNLDFDNSLYLFDIYNCNLTSDLTVLTACESGKVGYKDGEGMISLAHAFNYAGSKSILMGLWKIDEQSSARLLGLFYDNLAQGMEKDEAFRRAKLAYLEESEGRLLTPQYWAGLVLMGDTSPVPVATTAKRLYLFIGGIFLAGLVVTATVFYFRSSKRNET
jgi:CHAT domain-containing protein/tetratricopeptide (TPR) repeat protein